MSAMVVVAKEPPRQLPGIDHLSVSSLRTFLECPERWRRRYLDGEYEPSSPAVLVGNAVHRAEGTSYQRVIEGHGRLVSEEVLDVYSDEYELQIERAGDVDWEGEKPGRVKDSGARVLEVYHRIVAPRVQPVSVERRYELGFEGLDWTFRGYLDLETADDGVADLKSRSPKRGLISKVEAAEDLQPTGNLFARRAEGRPARRFGFHNLVRPAAKSSPLTHKHVAITPAHRTDAELDTFGRVLMAVAAEIVWRTENDWWRGPAQSWRCAPRFCGFWHTCEFGGANRTMLDVPGPTVAIAPTTGAYLDAVRATVTRTGTKATTSAKVAAYLGVDVRAAAAKLTAMAKRGQLVSVAPTRSEGRGKARTTYEVSGPRLFREPETVETPAA